MASKRGLKKQINAACMDVVDECFTFQQYNPGKNKEEADAIVRDAIAMRNDLIERVNQIKKLESDKLSDYINQLLDEFDDKNVELIERLNQLSN